MDCGGLLLQQISGWLAEKQGEEATLEAIILFVALILISPIICWWYSSCWQILLPKKFKPLTLQEFWIVCSPWQAFRNWKQAYSHDGAVQDWFWVNFFDQIFTILTGLIVSELLWPTDKKTKRQKGAKTKIKRQRPERKFYIAMFSTKSSQSNLFAGQLWSNMEPFAISRMEGGLPNFHGLVNVS